MALGLEQPIALDDTSGAHRAVDRTHDGKRIRRNRTCPGSQGARKEFVEARIGEGIRFAQPPPC